MKQKHNYVPCLQCAYRIEQADYDPHTELCKTCNNTRTTIDPKEILCNMCGNSMCLIQDSPDNQMPYGLHNEEVRGHYSSDHLNDTTIYTFSLCELCLRNMFNQFKIPPTMGSYMRMPVSTWEEDQEYYEGKIWRQSGGQHTAYMEGKCNAVKNCGQTALYTIYLDSEFTEYCACEEHKNAWEHCSKPSLVPFIAHHLKAFL